MTDERLRVALIERADEWSNRNRVSTTWRLVNDLRDELVRMSSGRADHDAAVERAAAVKALRNAAAGASLLGYYEAADYLRIRSNRIESGEQA